MKRSAPSSPRQRPKRADVRNAPPAIEGLERIFTTDEVAAHLRCSRQHVTALIRDELLGAKNIAAAGARPVYRIPESELRAFLVTRETGETEETATADSARAPRNAGERR